MAVNCSNCGQSFSLLGSVCPHCLNKRFHQEALSHQKELLARFKEPPLKFNLVAGELRPWHLMLLGSGRALSWCGQELDSEKHRVKLMKGEKYPFNFCEQCKLAYEEIAFSL